MRIINLSYTIPKPEYSDPERWLKKINHSVGILESMAKYAEVIGIYHIRHKAVLHKNNVEYHFPNFSWWQLLLPIRFNGYVKGLRPDIVIVHGLIFPWQVVMLHWQLGRKVKIIAQHHAEQPFRDIRQYLQRWADRYIVAYLFSSLELGRDWVERKQIVDLKKIKEIMEASSFFFPIEKQKAKSLTKVVGDKVFLWVGRLDANKDPLILAKAFARFNSKQNVTLYIIFQSAELLEELKVIILDANAVDKIHLVGKVEHEELQYWYNSADFIISSSHYEGSGISVCEGLSCGCIPIVTDIPSFRMMTDNGRIGILYEAENADSLVSALDKAQEMNLVLEKDKVLERFKVALSFDAISKKIMDVIYEIK